MTSSSEQDRGISDDQLPEDLQPDKNPLAEGLETGESAGDLLKEGKHAEQSEDEPEGASSHEPGEASEDS